MAPVVVEIERRLPARSHIVVHTGQHNDGLLTDVFMQQLGVREPDHLLRVGSASHAVQTAPTMERIEPVPDAERPDLLIVPGDVNSTLAAGLVAASFTFRSSTSSQACAASIGTMPEEINRLLTDQLASDLFVHCHHAIDNLHAEGIADERIYFVGNTMIDSLVAMEERFRNLEVASRLGLRPRDYLLVTLHRSALVDGPLLSVALRREAS